LYNIVVGGSELGPLLCPKEAGTWQRRPFVISPWKGSVFVGGWLPNRASTPCCMARSFTSIQMFHTHTHPRPRPGLPWKGKRKETNGHTMGKKRRRRGGEGKKRISRTTNLHGETDLPRTEHAQKIIGTNEEKIQFVFSSNMQDRALLS
jgi:hypothetical protein